MSCVGCLQSLVLAINLETIPYSLGNSLVCLGIPLRFPLNNNSIMCNSILVLKASFGEKMIASWGIVLLIIWCLYFRKIFLYQVSILPPQKVLFYFIILYFILDIFPLSIPSDPTPIPLQILFSCSRRIHSCLFCFHFQTRSICSCCSVPYYLPKLSGSIDGLVIMTAANHIETNIHLFFFLDMGYLTHDYYFSDNTQLLMNFIISFLTAQ